MMKKIEKRGLGFDCPNKQTPENWILKEKK